MQKNITKPKRKYERKAGKIANDLNYSSVLYMGDPVILNNLSAKELVDKNTGWAAICCKKLATIMSSIELKLFYAKGKNQKILNSHKEVDPVKQALIKKSTSNFTVKQSDQIVEITNHPLRELLFKVNDRLNYTDWISLNESYVETIGNSYNLIEFQDGVPSAMYPLLGEYVEINVADKVKSKIGSYIYKLDNKTYNYKPEEILHFVNYAPGNTIFGKGSLEICLAAVMRERYYDLYEYYLCKNFALPSFMINYKGHRKLTEKEREDLYRQVNLKFGSVKNSGKPIITEGDAIEITQLQSDTLRDMNFVNARAENRKVICGAYGIPLDLVDTADANRASALTAIAQFMQFTVFPKMNNYCELLNQQITPYFDDSNKLFVYFDNTIPTNPVEQSAVLDVYVKDSILTVDEARRIIGYEAKPEDDNEVQNQPE